VPGYNTLFARSYLLNFVRGRTARYHHRDLGERALREHGGEFIEEKEEKITYALLAALKEACDRRGCRLVLTAIPSATRGWSLRESTQRLVAFAQANGISYVDIREPLERAAGEGAALVYEIDGHWTREGHEVVGHRLSAFFLTEETGP
jgi:hypothetical protein